MLAVPSAGNNPGVACESYTSEQNASAYVFDPSAVRRNTPDCLRVMPCVGWKYRFEPDRAKPAKPPIDPNTGEGADVSDPETWGDFESAIEAVGRYGLDGIGIVLTPESGLTGIDLDHCRDPSTGKINERAEAILERLSGTYAEVSPSGTGLHLFVEGVLAGEDRNASAMSKRTPTAGMSRSPAPFFPVGRSQSPMPMADWNGLLESTSLR